MGDFLRAIQSGDKRRQLEAIRDKLAKELEHATKGADASALALRLRQVLADLESIPATGVVSAYDELAAKRTGGTPESARRQGGRRRRGGPA